MGTAMREEASISVLRRMKESGFDFAQYHAIEFYAVFADEDKARAAAGRFRGESINAQVCENSDGAWNLQISKVMFATHEGIGAFESDLQSIVAPLGGQLDGWGVTQEARP